MGFFDIFKKKRRTLLDQFNDIVDKGSQNTNTPLMCYKMAYIVLPQELHQNPTATLDRIRSQPDTAGVLFYTKACRSSGCLPKRQDASAFRTHMGRLSPNQEYFIIEYPSPPPPRLDTGMPVLAPYFSAAIVNETNRQPAHFVLGQALTGGTTLRTVKDGVNANMGSGSEPTLDAFLQLLRSIVKDKSNSKRPLEEIHRLNATQEKTGNPEKIPSVEKGDAPKDRFLLGAQDKIEHNKPEEITYKKGDFIGQKYEVHDVLGMGGLGIVYLVYSRETKDVYALKTFRDEFIEDKQVRDRFRKEAQVWVDLDRHPYLVRAYFVDEISGRLFIAMEYIASDERGLTSLDDYLKRRPPDIVQTLRWAIQFCYGMEFAYSKGIRAHRDIKPANILIGQDKSIKISDFGLAGIVEASKAKSEAKLDIQKDKLGVYQTVEGIALGTPPYMPPEQFLNAVECDERSDIYSFGVVLYQMATGGNLPFLPDLPGNISPEAVYQNWYLLHNQKPVPKLDSPLSPIIQVCLSKEKKKRHSSFLELRKYLEPLLKNIASEIIKPPELKQLEAWEWSNKALSLSALGHYNEAMNCCDKSIELDPKYANANAWKIKGHILHNVGLFQEAIRCINAAIEADDLDAGLRYNKGLCLYKLGLIDDAHRCFDEALEIDPQDAETWYRKGLILSDKIGRDQEAVGCFDRALDLGISEPKTWFFKGLSLTRLQRFEEAVQCYDKSLINDPGEAKAWYLKGLSLYMLDRLEESIQSFDKAISFDPQNATFSYSKALSLYKLRRFEEALHSYDIVLKNEPQNAKAWGDKGLCLDSLDRFDEAVKCYDKVLEIDANIAHAWFSKGNCLFKWNRVEDSICCYEKAIKLAPWDKNAWCNMGLSLHKLNRFDDAIGCFNRAIEIDPQDVKIEEAKRMSFECLGGLKKAISHPDKNGSNVPEDASFWHNKGIDLYEKTNFEKAIYCFEKVIGVTPKDSNAWFNKGLSLHRLGRFEEAILSLDKALEIDPRNGNAWYSKGQNLDSLNRLDEAIHCFDKALEIIPTYVIAWYAKALVQEKQEKNNEAADSFKQFISQAPLHGVEEIYAEQIEYASKRFEQNEKKKA